MQARAQSGRGERMGCVLCRHVLMCPLACVSVFACLTCVCLPHACLSVTHTRVPSLQSTVVSKALGCIAPSLPKAANTYTQALLAYTFALAKDSQRTQELLDILDHKAIRAGTRTSVLGKHQRRDE